MQVHPIPPVYDKNSRVLILGSFPSVKSRETMFYYGHPQNRFWRVLSTVLSAPMPYGTEEKKQLLLENRIALWDVIGSCDITGSADSSVKNVVPNDILPLIMESHIERIFVNGKTAEKYYNLHIYPQTNIKCELLPSTSPANAAYSLERLCELWRVICDDRFEDTKSR